MFYDALNDRFEAKLGSIFWDTGNSVHFGLASRSLDGLFCAGQLPSLHSTVPLRLEEAVRSALAEPKNVRANSSIVVPTWPKIRRLSVR